MGGKWIRMSLKLYYPPRLVYSGNLCSLGPACQILRIQYIRFSERIAQFEVASTAASCAVLRSMKNKRRVCIYMLLRQLGPLSHAIIVCTYTFFWVTHSPRICVFRCRRPGLGNFFPVLYV